MFWNNVSLKMSVFLLAAFVVACSCVYAVPPVAEPAEVTVENPNGITIELVATDPNFDELSYLITSLPEYGWLFEPEDGSEITETPYLLLNDVNSVTYKPCPYNVDGSDAFSFLANDGGIDPNEADSNVADVTVTMDMFNPSIEDEEDSTTIYVPFKMDKNFVRCQTLYLSTELGEAPMAITKLAVKLAHVAPSIEIQNWNIRIKHTTDSSFTSGSQSFEEAGLIEVYDANETITATEDWHKFTFDTAFNYNGMDNLIIDFSFDNSGNGEVPGSDGYVYLAEDEISGRRILANWSDSSMPTQSLYSLSNALNGKAFYLQLEGLPSIDIPGADFNNNCFVGMEDLLTMVDTWLAMDGDGNFNSACDIILNNKIDLADFAVLASEWMETVGPYGPIEYSIADFNFDRSVDTLDLILLVDTWLAQDGDINYNDLCDISLVDDDKIDLADFDVFSSEWMIPNE